MQPLPEAEWGLLLEQAGLGEIVVRTRAIETRAKASGMIQHYGYLCRLGIS